MVIASGCGSQANRPQQPTDAAAPHAEAADHSHGTGPHDGTIAEWGAGNYHVEFTVDHDAQQATVYILGGDAKTTAPVATKSVLLSIREPQFQIDLAPAPLEGEPEGRSSRFVGRHERLGKVQEFAGTISAVVDDKPYAGDFREEPHVHE
jgi:hypothetical protein